MMVTVIQSILGEILIFQGLFLWFALAFNGSVGEQFVNYFFFTSALLMIICCVLKISGTKWSVTSRLCLASIIFYLPVIWQRFDFHSGMYSSDFYFDVWVIVILLISLTGKSKQV